VIDTPLVGSGFYLAQQICRLYWPITQRNRGSSGWRWPASVPSADLKDTPRYRNAETRKMNWQFRRAITPGLAMLAVLTGMPLATAADPPREMRDLVRMSQSELEALYLASPPAPAPNGFLPGRAIKSPGSPFTAANARLTRIVWQGKIFRDDGTMINRMFGAAKAIPADVYLGESLIDGQPSLILDYSRSKLWPDVRDEIREVAPGLYLGVMYKGNPATQKMFFTLDARK